MVKKNSLIKVAATAVFMVIILALVFILPRLGMPIKTYAETSASLERAQASVDTFKDMRQSAKFEDGFIMKRRTRIITMILAGVIINAYAETKSDFKEMFI